MKRKLLTLFAAAALCVGSLAVGVSAADEADTPEVPEDAIVINDADELAEAIRDQEDGQYWLIKAGDYNLGEEQLAVYADKNCGGQTNWYFPIDASITIKGEGNPTITSDVETANGSWNTQDFITVWAEGVTIDGIQIKSKQAVNKAIEVMAKDFTIRNCSIIAPDDTDVDSGSIYFNPQNEDKTAGSSLIENVTIQGGIAVREDTVLAGTVTLKDVTMDYTGHAYSGRVDWGIISKNDAVIDNQGLTVKVDDSIDLQSQVIARVPGKTTIELAEGTYAGPIDATQELTIVGAGQDKTTIQFNKDNKLTKTYNEGNAYPIIYSEEALTLQNLTVAGPTDTHHGIDGIYGKKDLTLDNVTITDIRCTADGGEVCGVQYGKAVLAEGEGNVTVSNTTISNFQKNAMDLNTTGTVSVTDTTITGIGENTIIAQNGIVLRKGEAVIDNVTISDLSYTADNEWKNGSVGIYLLADATAAVTNTTIDKVDNNYAAADEAVITVTEGNVTYEVTTDGEEVIEVKATGISLDKTTASLNAGETLTLTATVAPEDTTETVTWTSSDPKVATVVDGKVTAVAAGKATITATIGDFTATCEVTVTVAPATTTDSDDTTGTTGTTADDTADEPDTGVAFPAAVLVLAAGAAAALVLSKKRK